MLQDQKIKSFADTIFTLDIFLYYCWEAGGSVTESSYLKGPSSQIGLHENGTIR
jgi:hypothetical protein